MPGSLDSCINSIYEPGNIPASAGIPPVRVLLKDAIEAAIVEAATAIDATDIAELGIDVSVSETAAALDEQSASFADDWILVDSWTYSSDVANVNFTGLAGYSEVRIALRNVSASISGGRQMVVSTNNGSSFMTTSGDYVEINAAGIETSRSNMGFIQTSSDLVRTGEIIISGWNLTAPKVVEVRSRNDIQHYFIPVTSALNALQVFNATGNLTGGSIYVFAR